MSDHLPIEGNCKNCGEPWSDCGGECQPNPPKPTDKQMEIAKSIAKLLVDKGYIKSNMIACATMPPGVADEMKEATAIFVGSGIIAQSLANNDVERRGVCEWTYIDDVDFYDTGCGNAFQFNEGDIAANDAKYCQYCGGAIRSLTKVGNDGV